MFFRGVIIRDMRPTGRNTYMKKKMIALFVALSMIFSFAIESYATDLSLNIEDVVVNSNTSIEEEVFNEYAYIEFLQDSTPLELQELGISQQDVSTLISEYEKALSERSMLSDSQLKEFGYSDAEIEILRAYADGETLSASELYAVSGTCTTRINRHYCYTDSASFSYSWEWDHCPFITLEDSAAMHWQVYDTNNNAIAAQRSSSHLLVQYYVKESGSTTSSTTLAYESLGYEEPNLDFNSINMQFLVNTTHGTYLECYAKTGTVMVTVKPPKDSSQSISYIHISGLYAHTLIGLGSPSLSIGKDMGLSFSGNTSIDSLGGKKATIYQKRSGVEYWG